MVSHCLQVPLLEGNQAGQVSECRVPSYWSEVKVQTQFSGILFLKRLWFQESKKAITAARLLALYMSDQGSILSTLYHPQACQE